MSGRSIGFFVLFAVVLILLAARLFGPGDLYDKDQPKTMAGSADVAINGNWIWPRDMLHEPATKPPMYNWLDAIVLKISPRWDEWIFKLPSIVAAIVVAWLIVVMTRLLLREHAHVELIAFTAAAIWIANPPVMKQMYLSRPDMVMTAFLTGAWVCGMRGMMGQGRTAMLSLGFWLCVACAALSKGPAAIIPAIYVPLLAVVNHSCRKDRAGLCESETRRSRVFLVHATWGAALFILIVGGWALLAYRHWPDAFWGVLKSEGTSRLTIGGPEAISKPFWLTPMWFVTKFLPWSLAAGIALILMPPKRWLRHELTPAIIWLALAVVAFSIPPSKRADYLLPAYPAAAILAAYGIIELARRVRIPVTVAALAPLLVAVYLAHWEWRRSPEAKTGYTRNAVAFVDVVRKTVPRDEPIIFLIKGYHPTLALLHRYEGNRAGPEDLKPGTWIIAPRQLDWPVYAVSRTLPDVIELGPKNIVPGEIALYRIGDDHVTPEALRPMLAEQYAWNFPPDRYRASRD